MYLWWKYMELNEVKNWLVSKCLIYKYIHTHTYTHIHIHTHTYTYTHIHYTYTDIHIEYKSKYAQHIKLKFNLRVWKCFFISFNIFSSLDLTDSQYYLSFNLYFVIFSLSLSLSLSLFLSLCLYLDSSLSFFFFLSISVSIPILYFLSLTFSLFLNNIRLYLSLSLY